MRSFSVLLLICALEAPAQQPWQIGMRGHYGYLWPHRPSSWILVEGHAPAVEVFAERQVDGSKPWQRAYAMPSIGVGFLYTDMANPERIGTTVRLLPYVQLPIVRGRKSDFGMRLGWGIGYVARPYDRTDNTKQIAIGSQVNAAIQIMAEHRVRVDRWRLHSGFGIDHWSNGSFRLPNLGLNMLALNLGVSYALSQAPAEPLALDTTIRSMPRREGLVIAAFGVNESILPYTGQYSAYTLTGDVLWRLTPKTGVCAGGDVFNKGSLATLDERMKDRSRLEYTQFGLHGGYALLLGRGEVFLQMGAYLYTPVPDDAPVYHRLGIRYRPGARLVLNMSLKSHYAVADHWEFGLGYRWE
ncbi:MAG: acyloxyacyl hydrolase [Flavobacteriales bacterium]|nr:acyloxyacyl hydrolase [Flavobacteriales bacterium]